MYGTTMIGTLATGVTGDDIRKEHEAWQEERKVPGFVRRCSMSACVWSRYTGLSVGTPMASTARCSPLLGFRQEKMPTISGAAPATPGTLSA